MMSLPTVRGLDLKCRVSCRDLNLHMQQGVPPMGLGSQPLTAPELLALLAGASCPMQSYGVLWGPKDAGQAWW